MEEGASRTCPVLLVQCATRSSRILFMSRSGPSRNQAVGGRRAIRAGQEALGGTRRKEAKRQRGGTSVDQDSCSQRGALGALICTHVSKLIRSVNFIVSKLHLSKGD